MSTTMIVKKADITKITIRIKDMGEGFRFDLSNLISEIMDKNYSVDIEICKEEK